MAPRQQQADAVLLEEAGPLREPDHLVAVAQQQLGNSSVYVRDTDPPARGPPAAAGHEGVYVGMQVELVSKGLHHSEHSWAKALLLADSLRHQVADGLPRRRAQGAE